MQTNDQLIEAVRNALQGLRGELIELYGQLGADPRTPQEVSRRFGLNRQLTWKLARVINAADPIASLDYLPGQEGVELAIAAFERAGAPHDAVARLRAAVEEFTRVVQVHAGGREELALILESMGLLEHERPAESSRELAYRGNSAIWGVQARARAMIAFVAPSASGADKLDVVFISGQVGVRRLRPSGRSLLCRHRDSRGSPTITIESLGSGSEGKSGPALMTEFCSPNMPPLSIETVAGGFDVLLPSGPVGNLATLDCYFGYIARGYAAHRGSANAFGVLGIPITIPVEMVVFDLVFHRSLAIGETVEALLYGAADRSPERSTTDEQDPHARDRLPMSERPLELAGRPPALSTPVVPAITRIAEHVYKRMGWDPKEFQGLRLQVPYPPASSYVEMRWPLPV
jgi:hypothetical protein